MEPGTGSAGDRDEQEREDQLFQLGAGALDECRLADLESAEDDSDGGDGEGEIENKSPQISPRLLQQPEGKQGSDETVSQDGDVPLLGAKQQHGRHFGAHPYHAERGGNEDRSRKP